MMNASTVMSIKDDTDSLQCEHGIAVAAVSPMMTYFFPFFFWKYIGISSNTHMALSSLGFLKTRWAKCIKPLCCGTVSKA